MTKVYILGAGFSKAFCNKAPLVNDYFTNIVSLDLKKKIDEYRRYGITENEYIASSLLDDTYDFDYRERLEKRRLIFEFLKEVSSKVENLMPDDVDAFQRFLHKYFTSIDRSTDEKKIIVTFNYDTLIEDNFEYVHHLVRLHPNPYPPETEIIGGRTIGAGIINLLKLHGSINWFRFSEEDNVDIERVFACHKTDEDYSRFKENKIPVFVPFSFNKANYMKGNLFGLIWQKFIAFLDECSDIEIIGYSFPQSDYQIVSKIASYREKISKITLKPTNDEQKSKLEKLFGEKVIFRDAKEEYLC